MSVKISCSLCGLTLGEAERAIEIVCPFCAAMRDTLTDEISYKDEKYFAWEGELMAAECNTQKIVAGLRQVLFNNIPFEIIFVPKEEHDGLAEVQAGPRENSAG